MLRSAQRAATSLRVAMIQKHALHATHPHRHLLSSRACARGNVCRSIKRKARRLGSRPPATVSSLAAPKLDQQTIRRWAEIGRRDSTPQTQRNSALHARLQQFTPGRAVSGVFGLCSRAQLRGVQPRRRCVRRCQVRIWDTALGDVVRSLSAHVGSVRAVCYSPDGYRSHSAPAGPCLRG